MLSHKKLNKSPYRKLIGYNIYQRFIARILLYSFCLSGCGGGYHQKLNMKSPSYIFKYDENYKLKSGPYDIIFEKELSEAFWNNDRKEIGNVLHYWPYPDKYREGGYTLLHLACIGNDYTLDLKRLNASIASVLLKFGADPTIADEEKGYTPICYAVASNNNRFLLREFPRNYKTLNSFARDGSNPLLIAYDKNKLRIFKKLLKYGADPNIYYEKINSKILELACKENKNDYIEALLADFDINEYSLTTYENTCKSIKTLFNKITSKPKPNLEVPYDDVINLLKTSFDHNNLEAFRFLIRKIKVKPDSWRDSNNKTLLEYICEDNKLNYAEELLYYDADCNKYSDNRNLLKIAYDNNYYYLFKLLLSHGADPNKYQSEEGASLLEEAYLESKSEYIALLLKKKAKLKIRENSENNFELIRNIITCYLVDNKKFCNDRVINQINWEEYKDENGNNIIKKLYDNEAYSSEIDIKDDNKVHVREGFNLLKLSLELKKLHPDDWKDSNGNTLLQCIVNDNNFRCTKLFLEFGANPNLKSNHENCLKLAYDKGYLEIFRLLLEKGAIQNLYKDEDGFTLLHYACKEGKEEYAKALIENKKKSLEKIDNLDKKEFLWSQYINNNENNEGLTPFHMVAISGKTKFFKLLFEEVPNIDFKIRDAKNRNLLKIAYDNKELEIFKYILEKKLNGVNDWEDLYGSTLLHYACDENEIEYMKLLLKYGGADPFKRNKYKYGHSTIKYALISNNSEELIKIIKKFTKKEFNVEENLKYDISYLKQAYDNKEYEILERLCKSGINLNQIEYLDQLSYLSKAIIDNDIEAINILLKYGSDPFSEDSKGFTAFHYASQNATPDIFKKLIETKNIEEIDFNEISDKHSLLYEAYKYKSNEMINFLVQKCKLDPDSFKNDKGETLLLLAAKENNTKFAYLLLKLKADYSIKAKKIIENNHLNYLVNVDDSIFHFIAETGNLDLLKILECEISECETEYQANKNIFKECESINCNYNINGESAIEIALRNRNYNMFEYFFKFLKNPNEVNLSLKQIINNEYKNSRKTLLQIASENKNYNIVKSLLNNSKVDPNIKIKARNSSYLLHYAIKNNDIKLINLLLSNKKTKLNIKDKLGRTAFEIACLNNNYEAAKILFPKTDLSRYVKQKLLKEVYFKGYFQILELLLDKGINPDSYKDKYGHTIFYDACENNRIKEIDLLLKYKANPDQWKNEQGYTLLKIAYDNKDEEKLKKLLRLGADPRLAKENNGNNILHNAFLLKENRILDIILKNNNSTLSPNEYLFETIMDGLNKSTPFTNNDEKLTTSISAFSEEKKEKGIMPIHHILYNNDLKSLNTIIKNNIQNEDKNVSKTDSLPKKITINEIEKSTNNDEKLAIETTLPKKKFCQKDEPTNLQRQKLIKNILLKSLNDEDVSDESINKIIQLISEKPFQPYILNILKLNSPKKRYSSKIILTLENIRDDFIKSTSSKNNQNELKSSSIVHNSKNIISEILINQINTHLKKNEDYNDEKENTFTKKSQKFIEEEILKKSNNYDQALKSYDKLIDICNYKISDDFIKNFQKDLFSKLKLQKVTLQIMNNRLSKLNNKEKYKILKFISKSKFIYPKIFEEEKAEEWERQSLIYELSKDAIQKKWIPICLNFYENIDRIKRVYNEKEQKEVLEILNKKKENKEINIYDIVEILEYLIPKNINGIEILKSSKIQDLKSNWIHNLLRDRYKIQEIKIISTKINNLKWDNNLIKHFIDKTKASSYNDITDFLDFLIKISFKDNNHLIDIILKNCNDNSLTLKKKEITKKWIEEIEIGFIKKDVEDLTFRNTKEITKKIVSIYKNGCSYQVLKSFLDKIKTIYHLNLIEEKFNKVIDIIYEYRLNKEGVEKIIATILKNDDIDKWENITHKLTIKETFKESKERNLQELIKEIYDKTENVQYVEDEKELENEYYKLEKAFDSESNILNNGKKISSWTKRDIIKWAIKVRGGISKTLEFKDYKEKENHLKLSEILKEKEKDNNTISSVKPESKFLESYLLRADATVIKPSMDGSANQFEIIAIVKRAVEVFTKEKGENKGKGYSPRDIQLLSLLTLLNPAKGKGRLAQINTGEGKSLIVAMLAAVKVFEGEKVDVITTSEELSKPEVVKMEPFFKMLNISVGENSLAEASEPVKKQKIYSKDIVYGTTSNFQGDILHHEYENKNIRNARPFSVAIVDEVDNMFIDGRSSRVQLTSQKPVMNHLALVLGCVWQHVSDLWSRLISKNGKWILCTEKFKRLPNGEIKLLCDESKKDQAFLLIPDNEPVEFIKEKAQDKLEILLRDLNNEERKDWNELKILEGKHRKEQSKLARKHSKKIDKYGRDNKKINSKQKQEKKDFAKKCEKEKADTEWYKNNREPILTIPKHLKKFTKDQTSNWVDNAIRAWQLEQGVDYEIINEKVIPIDKDDTGRFRENMVWSDGLAQFIEIKEGLRIDAESLSPSFISNYELFRRYGKNLFGLTGTLGSKASQEILSEIYNVDSVIIPPFKKKEISNNILDVCQDVFETELFPKEKTDYQNIFKWKQIKDSQYLCKELPAIIKKENKQWEEEIVRTTINKLNQKRGVLIICESVKKAEEITALLKNKYKYPNKIHTYTGKNKFKKKGQQSEEKNIRSGEVIVATNISGRGTDITTSEEIEENGGMHVCVTFLPKNLRVELQNMGRTARKGQNGTGQLIIYDSKGRSIEELRKERDDKEIEQLTKARKTFDEMKLRDRLFQRYCDKRKNIFKNNFKCQEAKAFEERWAMWLHKNIDCKEEIDEKEAENDFDNFEKEINKSLKKTYNDLEANLNHYDKNYYGRIVQNPHFFLLKGNEYSNRGYYSNAITYYKQAISIDEPYSLHSYYNRAYALIKRDGENDRNSHYEARDYLIKAKSLLNDYYLTSIQSFHCFTGINDDKKPISKQIQHQMDILGEYENYIDKAISTIDNVIDKGYYLTAERNSFNSVFKGAKENYSEDLANFRYNGLESFFTLKEKKPTPWWSIIAVACLGAIQIVVGAAIMIGSLGTGTSVGLAFMQEGINDILTSIESAITGDFSWEQWTIQKVVSLVVSAITLGWKAIKDAAEGAKNFVKTTVKSTKTIFSKTFKKGINMTFKTIGKELAKGATKKLIKVVVDETAKNTVIEDFEKMIYKKVEEKITSALEKNALVIKALEQDRTNGNNKWQNIIISEGHQLLQNEKIAAWLQVLKGVSKGLIDHGCGVLEKNENLGLSLLGTFSKYGIEAAQIANTLYEIDKFTDDYIKDLNNNLAELKNAINNNSNVKLSKKTENNHKSYDKRDRYLINREQKSELVSHSIRDSSKKIITENFTTAISGKLTNKFRAGVVKKLTDMGVDATVNSIYSLTEDSLKDLKKYKEEYSVEIMTDDIANSSAKANAKANNIEQSNVEQSFKDQEPKNEEIKKIYNQTKKGRGSIVNASIVSKKYKRPVYIYENVNGKKQLTKVLGEKHSGEPIKLIYSAPNAENKQGHWQSYSSSSNQLDSNNSDKQDCFFKSISEQTGDSVEEIRGSQANEISKNSGAYVPMAENIAKLRARDDGSLYQGGFAPAIPAQGAIMLLALLAAKKNKDKVSIDGISESLNKDGKYIRDAVTGSITSTMNLGIDLYYYAKSFGKKYFSSAPGLQNPLEYIPKVPNDSFLPGLCKYPDLLRLGNRISIFDGLPNDDNNGRYITDRALGLLGGKGVLMAKEKNEKDVNNSDNNRNSSKQTKKPSQNLKDVKIISKEYLKSKGVNAHELKWEWLGKKADIGLYDLYKHNRTGEILIYRKGGKGIPIQTGKNI